MKNNTLTGPSYKIHEKPQKLIFLLHGYGDNADNFIHIANHLDEIEFKANYIALNAPTIIPDYPIGRQWFPLNLNNTKTFPYKKNESETITSEILHSLSLLENTIMKIKDNYGLQFNDCFVIGFSQGGMIAFEFGNYFQESLAGIGIISSKIIREETVKNSLLLKTPIFISHGDKDEVLSIENFYKSCRFLKENKLFFEDHLISGDAHTISPKTISILKKFLKKYI